MPLTVSVPRETAPGERRVALVPETAQQLVQSGFEVLVERSAGEGAYHADAAYEAAGATLADRDAVLAVDAVLVVQPLPAEDVARLQRGALVVGFLDPLDEPQRMQALAAQGVTAFAMELVPRISRAQKMDALSAMSSLAGYRAVLVAAEALPKFFPLLTTAAGTVRPASVVVLGCGVAGLQALATARRLGARTFGYDIREAVREEVQSLGAKFIELEIDTSEGEGSGGYAKSLTQQKAEQQTQLLVPHLAKADVVITTALIPGRPAPLLVTEEAVEAMQPGSVIVDLAAPRGGNCALSQPGERVDAGGVQILGPTNLPSEMAIHASQLYSKTLVAALTGFVTPDGIQADFDDEVFADACVTHGGQVVHERVQSLLSPAD